MALHVHPIVGPHGLLQASVINAAVRRRDHDELRRLYVDDYNMNSVDPVGGLSPLATAAKYGLLDELELLYSMGADVGMVCDATTELTAVFVLITSADCPPTMRIPCLRLMCTWGGCDVDAPCGGESGLEHVARRTPVGVAPPADLALLQELVLQGAAMEGVFFSRATRAAMLEWTSDQLAGHDAAMTALLAAHSGTDAHGDPCALQALPAGASRGRGALATIAALVGLRSDTHLRLIRHARWVWLDALDAERHHAETHMRAYDLCLVV